MCRVRSAVHVHSHATHSGAHRKCQGEHLIVSEPSGHTSDCGPHVVEAAKVDSLRSLINELEMSHAQTIAISLAKGNCNKLKIWA